MFSWFKGLFRYVKPTTIRVFEDHLLAKRRSRSWRIELDNIVEVSAMPVLSLFDEVGIIVVEQHEFFFTDAEPWFTEVCDKLDLARHLGDDWHRRVEEGERMHVSFEQER